MNRIFIVFLVFTGVACKKNMQQTPSQPEPLFTVAYTVNNSFRTINAGKDGYYMYTNTQSDEFSIGQLVGEIKDDSPNKTNAFEFKFRSNSKTDVDLDSVLFVGEKELTDSNMHEASDTKVKLSLNAQETTNVLKYSWTVNTNSSSTEKSPSFVFDSNEDDNFPVSLQTFFNTGCVASTKRCINFSNTDCYADFMFTKDSNLEYTFSIPASMAGDVNNVVWYINNQKASTSKEFVHTFQGSGNFLISADVFFTSGCMSCVSKRIQVDYGNFYNGCLADFDIEYTTYNNAHYLQLNTLEINYWDESGVKYSSMNSANPGVVDILEVSSYEDNEVGDPTKKVRLSGEVRLTNMQGSEVTVNINEATIAVGVNP